MSDLEGHETVHYRPRAPVELWIPFTDTLIQKMTPYTLSKNRIFSGVTLTLYLGVQEVKMGLKESLTPINGCHDTYQ